MPYEKEKQRWYIKAYRFTDKYFAYNFNKNGIKILENTISDYKKATNCEFCGVEFNEYGERKMKNKKCLDHDHLSGYPRNIICHPCNMSRSKIDKLRLKLNLEIHRYNKLK